MQCSAGHENPEGSRYCQVCGLVLGQPAAAPPPTPPASYNTPSYNAPSSPAAYNPPSMAPSPGTPAQPYASPSPGFAAAPRNGMGTAALVLGILGLVLGCILSGLAIIFGSIGIGRANRGEATNKGAATAGLILGIVGFVLWTIIGLASLA